MSKLGIFLIIVAVLLGGLLITDSVVSRRQKSRLKNELEGKLSKITDRFVDLEYSQDDKPIRILWMQPVFLPKKSYVAKHLAVLDSFLEYDEYIRTSHDFMHHPNVKIDVVFGGWSLHPWFWEDFLRRWESVQRKLKKFCVSFTQVAPVKIEHNFGQAYVYRKLFDLNKHIDFSQIVTTGCDLYLPPLSGPSMHHAALAMDRLPGKVGLIAYRMIPADLHIAEQRDPLMLTTHPSQAKPHQVFRSFVRQAEGTAGSLSLISRKAYEEIDGYRVTGVYSSDDGYMNLDLAKAGYQMLIADNWVAYHEMETTKSCERFNDWKTRSLKWSLTHSDRVISDDMLLPWAKESESIFLTSDA